MASCRTCATTNGNHSSWCPEVAPATLGSWIDEAACRDVADPEMFFPSGDTIRRRNGLKLCASCPVQEECGRYALDARIDNGIWGGMRPTDRQAVSA